jgi:hypothetical protein
VILAKTFQPSFNRVMPWIVECDHTDDTDPNWRMSYLSRPLDDPFVLMPLNEWFRTKGITHKDYSFAGKTIYFREEDHALLFYMTFK